MDKPCFRCDGTGSICNVCGESERACECDEAEQSFCDCENCSGSGVASASPAGTSTEV